MYAFLEGRSTRTSLTVQAILRILILLPVQGHLNFKGLFFYAQAFKKLTLGLINPKMDVEIQQMSL